MKIIIENDIQKLIPTEKQFLMSKEDLDKPVEERYLFKFAYLPKTTTLEECKQIYTETDDGE